MNKRIQELEKQATETVECGLNGTHTAIRFNRKKFAELIIRECMSVARGMRNPPNLNYKPSDRFVDELRLHFGVE